MQTPEHAAATRAARVAVVGTGYVGSTLMRSSSPELQRSCAD